jgi:hypothetical protein
VKDAPTIYPADMFQGKPRFLHLGQQAFTLGGATLRYPLEKTGLLDLLIFRVSGQYDVATATLVHLPRSPWNILASIRLSPPGRQKPMDIGGWSARLFDLCGRHVAPFGASARDLRTDGLEVNTGRSAVLDAFPTGVATDQAFDLYSVLSFRRSATDPRGRIPLFNPSETVLYATPNTEANLVTVPGNWAQDSLNLDVWQVVNDDVAPSNNVLPVDNRWIVTYEEKEQVAAIGNNDITIDPGGKILQVIHTVALNDLLSTSDDISGIGLRVDTTDIIEPATDPRALYLWQKRALGFIPPDGVIVHDFDMYADSDGAAYKLLGPGYAPSTGRWLHTDEGVVEVESRITIPTGTTLGTNPRIYTAIKRLEQVGR